MRSMSGDGLQGSRRGIDNSADEVWVGEPRGRRRSGKASVGIEAGIDVNLEDPGFALSVDPEIDPGVTGEGEQVPAGLGKLREFGGERSLGLLQPEAPRRADIGLTLRGPFGVVANDAGGSFAPVLEQNLGDWQHAGAAALLKQSEVELASLDVAFREMLGAETLDSLGEN